MLLLLLSVLGVGLQAMGWASCSRLPEDVLPLHYDLRLRPDLDAGVFSGRVDITISLSEPRNWIAVNTKFLNISGTKLRDLGTASDLVIKSAVESRENEQWVVQTEDIIQPGEYILRMDFRGKLAGSFNGFYRSSYIDPVSKTKRYIATSKFQPTSARQAFPCFDEPSFKSQFSVKLVRPKYGYSSLSNMNVEFELPDEPATGLTTTVFATSVPMVTYLACFIVSDFQRLEPRPIQNLDGNNFDISVYSTPSQTSKTEYALAEGQNMTSFFINYFGIDYPLPKLDMIAIPDFVSGAMEHWGLITFREVNLLYDERISSAANKQRVSFVIGHELAHMWFGNLVTLKWWDNLWLNEGFASYMEFKATNNAHPDWKTMDQFLLMNLHPVLILDAALSSHPIVQEVQNPDQITEIFDTISYDKGSSIIRMLEDFMGEVAFSKAITNFLNKYKFSNAVTADLWKELQETIEDKNIKVDKVMDTWTRQMGYPVLEVTKNGNQTRVLTQCRFLANLDAVSNPEESPYSYKWDVPITYFTSENPSQIRRTWLHMEDDSVEISLFGTPQWFKINKNQFGFYRVNYELEDWNALINLLITNYNTLDVSDRANLLEDSFSLADASYLDFKIPLDLSQYLDKETEYVPWDVASTKFTHLKHLLQSSGNAVNSLKTYVQSRVRNIYNSVSWNVESNDSHLTRLLRSVILGLACSVDLQECKEQATIQFSQWMNNPNDRPHPDIRNHVYYYGMIGDGTEANWNKMWNIYKSETDAQERIKLLQGLASIRNEAIIRRFLNYAKEEANVRSQDYFIVLGYLSRNPIGNQIVWDYYRNNWKYLSEEKFELSDRYLGKMIQTITQYYAQEEKLQEMKNFYVEYPNAGAGTTARKQALEKVETNIKWLKAHETELSEWFESHK